jgi:hypothetical protein
MRNPAVFSFALTVTALAPSAVKTVGAGDKEIAELVKPNSASAIINGTTIDASVDRALVKSGESVKVKLVATSAVPRSQRVAVLVEESTGTDGGREPTPPITVDRSEVVLDARPTGGAPQVVSFALRGSKAAVMEGTNPFGEYTILVMPVAAADKLRADIRRAPDDRDFILDGHIDDAIGGDDAQVARLGVQTRDVDDSFHIVAPPTVHAGETFTVSMTYRNDTGSRTPCRMRLQTPDLGGDYAGVTDMQVEGNEDDQTPLAAGKQRTIHVKVTAGAAGVLGLYGDAIHDGEEELGSALEAIRVLPADGATDAATVAAR